MRESTSRCDTRCGDGGVDTEVQGGTMMYGSRGDVMQRIKRCMATVTVRGCGVTGGEYLLDVWSTCCSGPRYSVPRRHRCCDGSGGAYIPKIGCNLQQHVGGSCGEKLRHTLCASNAVSCMVGGLHLANVTWCRMWVMMDGWMSLMSSVDLRSRLK
jgi:hypothetical protein